MPFQTINKVSEINFNLSSKLAEDSNIINGVVLKHTEPTEARRPAKKWLWFVIKNGKVFSEPLHIYRSSFYLIGRERWVVDIPTDHPSCSGQHAVLQYRCTKSQRNNAQIRFFIEPYIIDLGSVNGTFLNGEKIEPEKYYMINQKDVIKFGNSSREYVLLHYNSTH